MKYVVTLNGKQYEVEVERVGGKAGARSLTRQPMQRGVRRDAEKIEKNEEKIVAAAAEKPVVKENVKPIEVKAETKTTTSAGGVDVTSPMPGVILDILVKAGDSVKFGQKLAVLEAMKMENDIPAPQDGVVSEVLIKKGDSVDTDAILIVLK